MDDGYDQGAWQACDRLREWKERPCGRVPRALWETR